MYKRQAEGWGDPAAVTLRKILGVGDGAARRHGEDRFCLLYTSDGADERSSVDLGGRRILKKKKR